MRREHAAAGLSSIISGQVNHLTVLLRFARRRCDGSPWTLKLKDVLDRAVELEMAYNPNDCVEMRWAAPASAAP